MCTGYVTDHRVDVSGVYPVIDVIIMMSCFVRCSFVIANVFCYRSTIGHQQYAIVIWSGQISP